MSNNSDQATDSFKQQLAHYKKLIDADIEAYSVGVRQVALEQYGEAAQAEVDAFLSLLSRGGKRIRGALVMVGYEMSGGEDQTMILKAARAIEMLHAFFLVIDDIQDRSVVRRNGPTAHKFLAQYHAQLGLKGDSEHFGLSIALNAAISGVSAAQIILAGLDADPQLKLNVISIISRTMGVTAHGQTYDILNELNNDVTSSDVDKVMQWKSAEYTFLNPLCVGMVLAGADCHATDAIRDYALNTGRAFQIADDILGTFGDTETVGKSPLDDAREGKQTLLTLYALEHADNKGKKLIRSMLGKPITALQFQEYKAEIERSGALDYAHNEVAKSIDMALKSLDKESHRWAPDGVAFLASLTQYMQSRVS